MNFNFKLENINYIKILLTDEQNTVYSIKAAIRDITEREIITCAKIDKDIIINTPQEITLSIVNNNGLYKTKTILKSIENDLPYIFLFLETPKNIDYIQNREFFRVPVNYTANYIINDNEKEQEYEVNVIDISANGISILTPKHIIPENVADISLKINERLLKLKIKYIRTEKIKDYYKISFTYINISEHDRDFISQICIKKQIEQRKRLLK